MSHAAGEPPLDEKVVLLHGALAAAGVAHAFGGALALAYYAEPRATVDVDVNVFVVPARAGPTLATLSGLGARVRRDDPATAERDGQVRLRWGRTPIDLFFAYDPFHEACRARVRRVPFGDAAIPVLAPEHLVVCKAVFDRRKDWLDIEQILFVTAPELNVDEVRLWMGRLVGADARAARLDALIEGTIGG